MSILKLQRFVGSSVCGGGFQENRTGHRGEEGGRNDDRAVGVSGRRLVPAGGGSSPRIVELDDSGVAGVAYAFEHRRNLTHRSIGSHVPPPRPLDGSGASLPRRDTAAADAPTTNIPAGRLSLPRRHHPHPATIAKRSRRRAERGRKEAVRQKRCSSTRPAWRKGALSARRPSPNAAD